MFEIVIGAGQLREIIAVKQARPVAARDFAKVGQHGSERRGAAVLVMRHGSEQGAAVPFDPVAIAFWGIGQHGGDALHPRIGRTHQGPEPSGVG